MCQHYFEVGLEEEGGGGVSSKSLRLASEREKAMTPHSSTVTWKIPWTEEPGGLQSMGSLRVGHD